MSNSSPPVIVVPDSASHASSLPFPGRCSGPSGSASHNGAGEEGTDLPAGHERFGYLRLAPSVMSIENLAMKAEPHQLEPGAGNGLIAVVAMPVAV